MSHLHKNLTLSVVMICIGYAVYNLTDAALKALNDAFPVAQVFFTNALIILLLTSLYGWKTEGKKAFTTKKPKLVLFRALFVQAGILCNIFSLPHIRLTTFYTLVFTAPLWVALISAIFLREKMELRRLGVILFGFSVVLFVFRPGGGFFNVWTGSVLFGALCYACQMMIVRVAGGEESRAFMAISSAALSIILSLPFAGSFIMPSAHEAWIFLAMGATGAIGFMCVSYAFKFAPSAAAIAPYHYTQLFWGAVLGYLLFNEVPEPRVMTGAALIIAAGLYLLRHETVIARRAS